MICKDKNPAWKVPERSSLVVVNGIAKQLALSVISRCRRTVCFKASCKLVQQDTVGERQRAWTTAFKPKTAKHDRYSKVRDYSRIRVVSVMLVTHGRRREGLTKALKAVTERSEGARSLLVVDGRRHQFLETAGA